MRSLQVRRLAFRGIDSAEEKKYAPPRLLAVGTEDEVRRVALACKVFYEKVPQHACDQYLIDHTSFTCVLDLKGQYAG